MSLVIHGCPWKRSSLRCLIKFRWMSNCVFVLLQEIMGSFPLMLIDVYLVADACALSGSGKTAEVMSPLYANNVRAVALKFYSMAEH